MNKILLIILCYIFIVNVSYAKYHERDYQKEWCYGKGRIEAVLSDRTRIDCLTRFYAIEFDYSKKWAEAIGQSLHYGAMTGKQPGIVLIIDSEADLKNYRKIKNIINKYNLPIQTWTIIKKTED